MGGRWRRQESKSGSHALIPS